MSSFAAKKRSVNATRRKTKKRIIEQFGSAPEVLDEMGSQGLRKRRKLYAHQKAPQEEKIASETVPLRAPSGLRHVASQHSDKVEQEQVFLKAINDLRNSAKNKRRRSKVPMSLSTIL